jgi:hypothetical protein
MKDEPSWIVWVLGAAITILGGIIAHLFNRIARAEDRTSAAENRANETLQAFRKEVREDFDKLWGKIDYHTKETSEFREFVARHMVTKDDLRGSRAKGDSR